MKSRSTRTSKRAATGWVVALTAIGSLMAALDTLVVSTSLSAIRLDLGASVEQLEWTLNAYNLSFAVLLITAAALGDRYGRRAFYAIGLGLFAAASAASALAPSVGSPARSSPSRCRASGGRRNLPPSLRSRPSRPRAGADRFDATPRPSGRPSRAPHG